MTVAINEELWFGGDSADRKSEDRAARSMAAMVGRIIGAKPFPAAARKLADLTRTPNVKMEDVVRTLEGDPGLSARLLRLVNSAGYSLRVRCTSVRHAATLVGSDRLNQIATTAAVLDMFDAGGEVAARILEHTTVVGALSRYLAAHLNLPADDLFTCGFLHDIGKLMLLESEKSTYVELLEQHGDEPDTLHHLEREMFGFDHAVLAGHVLEAWEIPHPVPKVVAWHHSPSRAYKADPTLTAMIHTLRLADALAYALRNSDDDSALISKMARTEAASYLEISEAQLDAMWSELRSLEERSRGQANGETPVIDVASMEPRRSKSKGAPDGQRVARHSYSPESRRASKRAAAADVHDVPLQFPCVVCEVPTYANTCTACGGHACPDHQDHETGWCALCQEEYADFVHENRVPMSAKLGTGAVLGGLLVSSVVGAIVNDSPGMLKLVVGPVLVLALAGVILLVVRRSMLRRWFLQHRPERFQAAVDSPASTHSMNPPPVSLAPAEVQSIKASLIDSLSANAPRASIRAPELNLSHKDEPMLRELRRLTLGSSIAPPSLSLAPISVRDKDDHDDPPPTQGSLLPDRLVQSLAPDASITPPSVCVAETEPPEDDAGEAPLDTSSDLAPAPVDETPSADASTDTSDPSAGPESQSDDAPEVAEPMAAAKAPVRRLEGASKRPATQPIPLGIVLSDGLPEASTDAATASEPTDPDAPDPAVTRAEQQQRKRLDRAAKRHSIPPILSSLAQSLPPDPKAEGATTGASKVEDAPAPTPRAPAPAATPGHPSEPAPSDAIHTELTRLLDDEGGAAGTAASPMDELTHRLAESLTGQLGGGGPAMSDAISQRVAQAVAERLSGAPAGADPVANAVADRVAEAVAERVAATVAERLASTMAERLASAMVESLAPGRDPNLVSRPPSKRPRGRRAWARKDLS